MSTSSHTIVRTTTQNDITIAVESTRKKNKNDQENDIDIKKTALANSPKIQRGLLTIYRSNLLKKTYQHVVYPESAIDKNQQGDVVMRIIITRSGKIKTLDFKTRASYTSLNRAAKRAIEHAKPFPAAPNLLRGEQFEILMPIKFRLAD